MKTKEMVAITQEVHAILNGIKALVAVDHNMDAAAVSMDRLADMGIEKLEALWE